MDVFSQVGGKSSFGFLNTSASARLSALGGVNVSLADRDVNFFSSNPSLNSDSLQGFGSVNYQFYVADIGHALISYAHNFEKAGVVNFSIQHMNYGSFQGYDDTGLPTSNLSAGETALIIGKSHQVGAFRFGANVKGIFSNLAGYRATAVALDLGGLFVHPTQQLTIGLAFKNLGFVLSEYSDESDSKLPFDVQVGASIKPQHMPVRFSLTAFNLTLTDVSYHDPAVEDGPSPTLQKILTHFNFGSELLVHKKVNILVGYNYLNHQALKLENSGGGAGLCLGFSVAVKSVDFVFSRTGYVAGSGAYSFTLTSDLNKFLTKK